MKFYIGDITEAPVEVIVNASDADFSPGGGLSRWIAKQGGEEIFKEAREKYGDGEVGKPYFTGAGTLKARAVCHIPTVNWKTDRKIKMPEIHSIAMSALEESKKMEFSSIAFPLLGAGTLKLNTKEVAAEIVDAVLHFEGENSGFVGCLCVLNGDIFEEVKGVLPDNVQAEKL